MKDKRVRPATPLYESVRAYVLDKISTGVWGPGSALPSESALADLLDVSQGTVRKALSMLELERVLERTQGRGTFVTRFSPPETLLRFFRFKPESGAEQNPRSVILDFGQRRATRKESAALELKGSQRVYVLRRLRRLAQRPALVDHIVLPKELLPGFAKEMLEAEPDSLYVVIQRRFNVTALRCDEQVRAVVASAELATLLQVDQGATLLHVTRVTTDINRRPMELRVSHCVADSFYYSSKVT